MEAIAARLSTMLDRISATPQARLDRLSGVFVGVPALSVLGIAAWLTPAAAGFGTHTQLGLGACTMLALTGWPCPMCGMTTTFALMAHLRPVEALANQPFGVVLFLVTAVAGTLGAVDALVARGALRWAVARLQRREQLYAILLLGGMITGWVYKCVRMHPEVFATGG